MKKIAFLLAACSIVFSGKSQTVCASAANIYTFATATSLYEVVKEAKTWTAAAACAVQRGGYLVEIGNMTEQTAVYNGIVASGIPSNYSPVMDGGGASYVWIGANDKAVEGRWMWDGDDNNTGINFFSNGFPVTLAYNNWGSVQDLGSEPDDFQGNQDAAAIALGSWPYGSAGQWNDVAETNTNYFVVEKPLSSTGIEIQASKEPLITIFPNPVKDNLSVFVSDGIKTIEVMSVQGRVLGTIPVSGGHQVIDMSPLSPGFYLLVITSQKDQQIIRKITKE